ncbi:MAG: 23S rRNA (uracil(1939)-C(5))-methyltransferase RlmD, partial [Chlamydiae bacterium]|nr:23S rRNA (uracil(1939)-C(5))-methyltransferase RlmD [Chlamydiota bacterium]
HKVEVDHTVPGDVVSVKIGRKRKGFFVGYDKRLVSASHCRVEPKCSHADYCGGCIWQQLSYERQLQEKEAIVRSLFKPLTSESFMIDPIIPCLDPWQYRNKMEYTFSENKQGEKFLGLIMSSGKGRVFNLHECHITHPWFAKTVVAVRSFWEKSDLKAFNIRSAQGTLRTLTLRRGVKTGSMLVMLTVSGDPSYGLKRHHLDDFVKAVQDVIPEEEKGSLSVFIRVHQAIKGEPTQFFEMHLAGPDHLHEELQIDEVKKKFHFKISPTAFFQPNTLQAERLYGAALSLAGQKRYRHVLDLYAGTSTLGILFSSLADHVTSIEINPHATFDAQVNKEVNAVTSLQIIKGDVAEELEKLRQDPQFSPDLVVIDPPRTGLDAKAISLLLKLDVPSIIYISCNPKSQADNVRELLEGGYVLEK